MKICIIGSAKSIHIQKWGCYFASRGHEVTILSNLPGWVEGTQTFQLYDTRKFGKIAYLMSLLRVRELIRSINPDLVHFHYLGGISLYSWAMDRSPLVATPWGSDIYHVSNPIMKYFVRKLLHKASRILTTSTSMAGFLMARYGVDNKKIGTYSWGIDTSLFRTALPEEKKNIRKDLEIPETSFVIFSNRVLSPLYQIDMIVRAFLDAEATLINPYLIILEGDDDISESITKYRASIRSQCSGHHNIRFLRGPITSSVMAAYLKVSDVAISIPNSDQRSTSVLEALATTPAIILSDLPAYRDLRNDGYLFTLLENLSEKFVGAAFQEAQSISHAERKRKMQWNSNLIHENENWTKQAALIEKEYLALIHP